MSPIIEQKYGKTYVDYPKDNLISFLGPSEKKITEFRGEGEGYRMSHDQSPESLIDLDEDVKKTELDFWHYKHGTSVEEYENKLKELKTDIQRLNQEIENINQRISKISQEKDIPQIRESIEERKMLAYSKQELLIKKTLLEDHQTILEEEYFKNVSKESTISLNDPENKVLLQRIRQQIKNNEENLQHKIRDLKGVKESLSRIEKKVEQIHSQWNQTEAGRKILTLWSK